MRDHELPGSATTLRWLSALPQGRSLSEEVWALRHRGLTALLWAHVPALWAFALMQGFPVPHATLEALALAALASAASSPRLSRSARSAAAALGLVVASSLLVHLWGGVIEGHFHFFVVIGFLALYQSWLPFLLALGYVVLEHGIVGMLDPESMYNHAAAIDHPWRWALIHGVFVLAASTANLLAWRITEDEALHDSLTGLPNRAMLLDRLTVAFDARRDTTAVLYLDLDDFKDANDGFGHDVGDAVLQQVARRLADVLDEGELLARLGGDEFAVLLTRLAGRDHARDVAARVQQALAAPVVHGGLSLAVDASVGLAFGADTDSALSLLRNADLAMLTAKRSGGGRWREYESVMHSAALRRTELGHELRAAIESDQLEVHYQPIFSLSSGRIVGTEALVRWRHETRGMIAPTEFIPVAEQSGLIVALGGWVLRTACAKAAQWQADYPCRPPLTISVNLSPRQLAEPALLATVVGALRDSGLQPSSLCLEITEGSLIRDLESTLLTLGSLKAVGLRLALDDFGTGYSSLSYLQRLPVDIVKIDRSFVAELGERQQERHIVAAVVDLARALGLSVTAEGIETREQHDVLREIGCDNGQGYLRSPPLPANELDALLAQEARTSPVPAPRGSAEEASVTRV